MLMQWGVFSALELSSSEPFLTEYSFPETKVLFPKKYGRWHRNVPSCSFTVHLKVTLVDLTLFPLSLPCWPLLLLSRNFSRNSVSYLEVRSCLRRQSRSSCSGMSKPVKLLDPTFPYHPKPAEWLVMVKMAASVM